MRGSAHILQMNDKQLTKQIFDKLADGGVVTTLLDTQDWGGYFGKLSDQFGVQWMLNCSA